MAAGQVFAVAPTLRTPIVSTNAGSATLSLQSSETGTGYFTLLPGTNATCGTGAQTQAGQDSGGSAASPLYSCIGILALLSRLHALRSILKAHSSVEEKNKEERQVRATHGTLRAHFNDLAGQCDKRFVTRASTRSCLPSELAI